MKRYLGSGLVKGIGPVMAGRIVDAFGEATFDVIDETPERLTEVPGIGPVRAGRIAATWVEQRHIREVMAALQGYGISTSLAVRIYKRFGDDSARVIAQEPYRLAREVWGIGFKTADKIAQAVGIAPDAPERLQAGVLHALGAGRRRGPHPAARGRPRRAGGRVARGRGGADHRGDHRPHRDRRARSRQPPTGTERRTSGSGCWPWRPSPVPSPGWPPACRRCTPRPDAPGSGRSSPAIDWDVAFALAGRAPRRSAGARAGGRGAHGADRPGLHPHRRPRHRQDPHPARDPDAWPRPSGCAACWPPPPGARPSG